MANHRPKSLSELNNVYDKAMRAERAIREGSDMLSIPDVPDTAETEDIFTQLEAKAAEAQKKEVFDPDITNIANDFLKRFAQPEKPKTAPREIKRPAPSIQSAYHSQVKNENKDIPLSESKEFATPVNPQSAHIHKPSHTVPSTDRVRPEVKSPETEPEISQPKVVYSSTETENETPDKERLPAENETAIISAAAAQAHANVPVSPAVDHTPRPAASRIRITSTERSELMEEYLKVMSDDDDEPSYKKPLFSFFKKKKKLEDTDEPQDSDDLYDENPAENDSPDEETGDIPFEASEAEYADEYSDAPSEYAIAQEPMNLYDYIEADFTYDEEEDEDAALDMSFIDTEKIAVEEAAELPEETAETAEYPTQEDGEEISLEYTEELSDEASEEIAEEAPDEEALSADETDDIPEAKAEETVIPEEAEETVIPEEEAIDDPTAGMVFEDIFSVSDESKRSHTGGNWSEVFENETAPADILTAQQTEEAAAEEPEYVPYEEVADDKTVLAEVTEEASDESQSAESERAEEIEENEDAEEDEEDYEAPKKRTLLKVLMTLTAIVCIAFAGASVFLSAVIGVDSGKLFSEKYRAFSVSEELTDMSLGKGDLVITENTYAKTDDIFVYTDADTEAYCFGKVTASTSNLSGDYLYIAQTKDGIKMINRDTSLGVVEVSYSKIGSALSAVCEYGIFLAVALVIFAAALIISLVILIRNQRRYEQAAAIYDNPDNFRDYDDKDNDGSSEDGEDGEYYSDYDTEGIEQGLFVDI